MTARTTEPAFPAWMGDIQARMEGALARLLPEPRTAPARLHAAMRYATLEGGKRVRPLLAFAAGEVTGADPARVEVAAAAVEMIHAYSLVHDDLPCMDDAQLRRGKPCVHVLWGEAMGVLAGDALLTLAFEVLGQHSRPELPIGKMVAELGRGAGWNGMVGGQVHDLAGEGGPLDLAAVKAIHLGKTAALIASSLRLGALAGGADTKRVEHLGRVGIDLGLAFQIVDDLLDLEGSTEALGKPAGADAVAGKATWPAAVGPERARADAEALVARALTTAGGGACEGLFAALGQRILRRSH